MVKLMLRTKIFLDSLLYQIHYCILQQFGMQYASASKIVNAPSSQSKQRQSHYYTSSHQQPSSTVSVALSNRLGCLCYGMPPSSSLYMRSICLCIKSQESNIQRAKDFPMNLKAISSLFRKEGKLSRNLQKGKITYIYAKRVDRKVDSTTKAHINLVQSLLHAKFRLVDNSRQIMSSTTADIIFYLCVLAF